MWETGSIPTELLWTALLLIPKLNVDNWGIGILEVFWKVVEEVIENQINSVVQFHDGLHGFCAGRGTGTSTMELKLAQELASVDQDLLFLLFLYIRKAYYNLDWGKLIQTLEGYGAVLKLWGLLEEFWSIQEVVTRKNGFHGPQFQSTRLNKQG